VGDVHIIKAVTKKKEKQTFPDKQKLKGFTARRSVLQKNVQGSSSGRRDIIRWETDLHRERKNVQSDKNEGVYKRLFSYVLSL